MTSRKALVLAAVGGLMVGSVAFAQQQQQQQRGQSGQGQSGQGQAGQGGQQQQRGQQQQGGQRAGQQGGQQQRGGRQAADEQINQLMAQIAQDPETAADKVFLLTAILDNAAQLQLAREVSEKSQNPQVKKLAQRMMQELQQSDQQLRQTAQAVGLQVPEGLARAHAMEIEIIAALPADQMDRAYTASVMADGASAKSNYQSQSQIAQNDRVRQMSQQQARACQMRHDQTSQTAQALGMQGAGEDQARPAGATIPRGQGGQRSGGDQQNEGTDQNR
jgi:predicted outer membrane protein